MNAAEMKSIRAIRHELEEAFRTFSALILIGRKENMKRRAQEV